MPRTDLHITRAWRFHAEPDRVHFIVADGDGQQRHLHEPNDSALGRVLDATLRSIGYTGPGSGTGDDESDGLPAEQ